MNDIDLVLGEAFASRSSEFCALWDSYTTVIRPPKGGMMSPESRSSVNEAVCKNSLLLSGGLMASGVGHNFLLATDIQLIATARLGIFAVSFQKSSESVTIERSLRWVRISPLGRLRNMSSCFSFATRLKLEGWSW